jgi:hypothetical protein
VHIWKDIGGRIHFVPWDLDLSLGQPSYNDNENPEGWILYRPDWLAFMSSDPVFVERLELRWHSLRETLLSNAAVLARIERYQTTLGEGLEENFEIWPIEGIQFSGNSLYAVSSYEEEITQVQSFVEARASWLDMEINAF